MKIRHQNLYQADIGREEIYILADDAAEAAKKVQEHIEHTTAKVVDVDGSLNVSDNRSVRVIRMIANKVIY